MKIALVTAIAAFTLDEDLAPLQQALEKAGVQAIVVAWDDPTVSWQRFDAALLRSPWDYTDRLDEFLAWAERVAALTELLNPLAVIRRNTDKHYLADLDRLGLAVVPSQFVEPGEDAAAAVAAFLSRFGEAADIVVKPAVGAGSRDAQRHARGNAAAAIAHVQRLLAAGRSVLIQPYLASVDQHGETALLFFDGEFSHAIRKGPLLRRDEAPTNSVFAPETIVARPPTRDELELAQAVLAALPESPLAYARVDLIRDDAGAPRLLELELTEPSLFFRHAEGAAERFVAVLQRRLAPQPAAEPAPLPRAQLQQEPVK